MKKKIKCFVCHKEINEEEDYVFMGKTVHKGECLKSMIDEYNAVRNLQIRNKRLCAEIERLNNIINELERYINEEYIYDELGMKIFNASTLQDKLQELKGSNEPSFEEMVNFVENVYQDIKNQSTLDEELEGERERIAKIVGNFKGADK